MKTKQAKRKAKKRNNNNKALKKEKAIKICGRKIIPKFGVNQNHLAVIIYYLDRQKS